MRSAPPVQYPVGLFLWGLRAPWLLLALVVLSGPVLLWGSAHWSLSWGVTLPLALVLGLALWDYQRNQSLCDGQLQWLEGQWSYLQGEKTLPLRHVRVLWDAGDRLWLRVLIPVDAQLRWRDLWLLERDGSASWHLMRCAVAAHTGKNFTQPSHST